MERQLIADYVATVHRFLDRLSLDNRDLAIELAAVPEKIRGFGHVKHANAEKAKKRWKELEALYAADGRATRPTSIHAVTAQRTETAA